MLTLSQTFMLQCVSDFIYGRETTASVAAGTDRIEKESPEGKKHRLLLNWSEIFEIAGKQSLEGILYYQCRDQMPKNIKKRYFRHYLANGVFSIEREKVVRELATHLEEQRIQVIFMKGAVLRDYYPVPQLRSMGDIDFVIRPEDREETDRILRNQMGFERSIDVHEVWTYWKGKIYLEVHSHMFYAELANRTDYRSYFDHVWEHCHKGMVFGVSSDSILVPDVEYHFLYLAVHTAKHIIASGSGFRAYMDMAILGREAVGMDWDYISKELEQLSLREFAATCMTLCERWFGTSSPMGLEKADEEFLVSVTEKTFRDGVFGLENSENVEADTAKQMRRFDGPYYIGALKQTVRKLFPAYRDMQLIPWYSFVNGRPWLLPFAWIYRWIYCGTLKMRHSWKKLAIPFANKTEVEIRQEYLSKWGL